MPDAGLHRDAARHATVVLRLAAGVPAELRENDALYAVLGIVLGRAAAAEVTVVDGLPRHGVFLKALCQELKRDCGTGGAVVEGTIELQGDLRSRVREVLLKKGLVVKG